MSLPYPFSCWVVAEQQGNEVGRLPHVSLAVLNLAELNLHPRSSPWYSLFLYWNLSAMKTVVSSRGIRYSPSA